MGLKTVPVTMYQFPENFDPQHDIILHTLFCPISQEIIREPVVTSEGMIYEESQIVGYMQSLQAKGRQFQSPTTRETIHNVGYRSFCVKNMLQEQVKQVGVAIIEEDGTEEEDSI
jgi:hypothetical protein